MMLAIPGAIPLAIPSLLIEATLASDEVHWTVVTTRLLPSENVPVAVNCCENPAATAMKPGVIWRAVRLAEGGVDDPLLETCPPLQPTRIATQQNMHKRDGRAPHVPLFGNTDRLSKSSPRAARI